MSVGVSVPWSFGLLVCHSVDQLVSNNLFEQNRRIVGPMAALSKFALKLILCKFYEFQQFEVY